MAQDIGRSVTLMESGVACAVVQKRFFDKRLCHAKFAVGTE